MGINIRLVSMGLVARCTPILPQAYGVWFGAALDFFMGWCRYRPLLLFYTHSDAGFGCTTHLVLLLPLGLVPHGPCCWPTGLLHTGGHPNALPDMPTPTLPPLPPLFHPQDDYVCLVGINTATPPPQAPFAMHACPTPTYCLAV